MKGKKSEQEPMGTFLFQDSKVYKVLSKIDGKHYALKEIKVIQLKEGVNH